MMRPAFPLSVLFPLALLSAAPAADPPARLGVDGTRFTLGGNPAFLLGASMYGALGASDEALRADLDDLRRLGFNWIRVWATWGAFGNDVSAVDSDGAAREPWLGRLVRLVEECDRRGMVVDVTLSRGNGVAGSPRLGALPAHRRAAETIAVALRERRNWYLDLANERNIRDPRHASFADLAELREAVRRIDPGRLVTASHAGDLTREELRAYLLEVKVDMVCPHRPRDARSPSQTEAKSREYLKWMDEIGRRVPLHYQEPFRRGFGDWDPSAADFVADLRGAMAGGAAGWCFHNGDVRSAPDGRPRRSFDFREGRLFDKLDAVERQAIGAFRAASEGEPEAAGTRTGRPDQPRDTSKR